MSMENTTFDMYQSPELSFLLSPGDSDSNADTERQSPNYAFHKYHERSDVQGLYLDNFVLPTTPEDSQDELFIVENVLTDSSAPDIYQDFASYPHSTIHLDDLPHEIDELLQPESEIVLKSRPCLNTQQPESLPVTSSNTPDPQIKGSSPGQPCAEQQATRFSEANVHFINDNEDRIEQQTNVSLEQKSNPVRKDEKNSSRKSNRKSCNTLEFPPCAVCSRKASGSHYGAITCEACKGFFRRYLQKKTEFKCTKDGKCAVSNGKRGSCSECRLKKCLSLGMSKEKSKFGRYTLTERTEAIVKIKQMEETALTDIVSEEGDTFLSENRVVEDEGISETDIVMRNLIQSTKSLNISNGFNDMLVIELVNAMDNIQPYGKVKSKEQMDEIHKQHSERYMLKTKIFGQMNTVPVDEYKKLYNEFGLDIDGRMASMKIECEDIETDMDNLCNFARHIPGFVNLPLKDQSNLLKTLMIEFYTVVTLDCYNDAYGTFISKDGRGYHFDEMAGREYSAKLLEMIKNIYCRLQKLELNKEELAVMAALTLVSPDRCRLKNRGLVEKIQLSLTDLLQQQIKKKEKCLARGKFSKIIDILTLMREMTELHIKENNSFCKDDFYLKEFPYLVDFIIEETD